MKLIGTGRLGRDVEVKKTQAGKSVGTLSLAWNYGRKDDGGKQPSQWVEASMWGEQVEKLAKYLKKGTVVDVVLRDVHTETYEGRNGTGHKLVGTVCDFAFTPGQKSDGGSQSAPAAKPAQAAAEDDDIPFN